MSHYRILGLEKDPFSSSADPAFFFPAKEHKAVLVRLLVALRFRRGLSLVLGEAGTGKTTLSRRLFQLASRESQFEVHVLPHPDFSSEAAFLAKLAEMFQARPECGLAAGRPPLSSMEAIEKRLIERNAGGQKTVVLIIDEAQRLTRPCLEALRVLSGFEAAAEEGRPRLLQVVLFAQADILPAIVDFKNFWDRIGLKCVLEPLDRGQTKKLIDFRARAAGYRGEKPLFPDAAVSLVHRHAQGYPRRITALAHDVLETLLREEKTSVDRKAVRRAIAAEGRIMARLPQKPRRSWKERAASGRAWARRFAPRAVRLGAGTAIVTALILGVNALGFFAAGSLYDGTVALKHTEKIASAAHEDLVAAERRELTSKVALLEKTLEETELMTGQLASLVGMERLSLQKGVGPIPDRKDKDVEGLAGVPVTTVDILDSKVELAEDKMISLQARIRELTRIQEDKLLYIASTPSLWPVRGWITSDFGYRRSPFSFAPDFHEGVDIAAARGTPVLAPADGVVTFAGTKGGYGKTVIIDHGFGVVTRFGHTSELFVAEGQKVARGDKIAAVGNTGHSTGPHLHYEILSDGVPVDPMKYIVREPEETSPGE